MIREEVLNFLGRDEAASDAIISMRRPVSPQLPELPTLKIYGLAGIGEGRLGGLEQGLIHALSRIPGGDHLKNAEDVLIWFPTDGIKSRTVDRIMVEVTGLEYDFWKQSKCRSLLIQALGDTVHSQFPSSRLVVRLYANGHEYFGHWEGERRLLAASM